ncbi:Hypothetical protein CINCED_3A021719 [Cinara cedri]|uniref:Uncharacterized protein n=1 Tax=Cinara cedri TaxID=506608 RepID=A0A5E4M241_9HEMI|nr:Hypothetical protein CINCED_3A021719 [Cinara cedri]
MADKESYPLKQWFSNGVPRAYLNLSIMKKCSANLMFTHCFFHREAFVTKSLMGDLGEVLDHVVKVINHIKISSLKSRLFEHFCQETDSEYTKLLFHSDAIRRLSSSRTLSRYYDFSEELIAFSTTE